MNKTIVSIDLWGTLIKASPSFKKEKLKLVQSYFLNHTTEYFDNRFKNIKQYFDYIMETTGYQPPIDVLWEQMVGGNMTDSWLFHSNQAVKIIIDELKMKYAILAIENPPSLYDSYTKTILEEMSSQYQLVLSSNTLFLEGWVLREILDKLDISKYFTKMNFSNELGFAKPNPLMYSNSKYHIGDNPITDGEGAINAGSIPFIVNNNKENNLVSVMHFLKQQENKNGTSKIRGT